MDTIAVIDFGGQYAHLIANRVRRQKVFAEVLPPTSPLEDLERFKGVIFSGGPSSVYAEDAPAFNRELLATTLPLLGICYGHQIMTLAEGGSVERGQVHEFGPSQLAPQADHPLFKGMSSSTRVWMSHGDEVSRLPEGYKVIGQTSDCRYAAIAHDGRKRYGIQFHPEVTHTAEGGKLLSNFLDICGVAREWNMEQYLADLRDSLTRQCQGKKVFLLVSGGVDSTVAFALLNEVLGPDRVSGLHMDNGLMRKNESREILDFLQREGFHNLKLCDARKDFLSRLKGVTAPEEKRKIIGDTFLDVLNSEVASYNLDPSTWLLAQGTTYPDTIESGGTQNAATIKTHHNRVPAALELLERGIIIEPLADLYKDEVRALGETLGVPHSLVWRHPFPGPGLGVRLLCHGKEDTGVDAATTSGLQALLEKATPEAKAIADKKVEGEVVPIHSVGVQGDSRTYAHPCLLKNLRDWDSCDALSTRITNQLRGINRVVLEVHRRQDGPYQVVEADCNTQRLDVLREADALCTGLLREENLYDTIWQMPVVLLPLELGGRPVIVMRPIDSAEAMTASFTPIDFAVLDRLWRKLDPLKIGALWFDVTHKPPGTIEWE